MKLILKGSRDLLLPLLLPFGTGGYFLFSSIQAMPPYPIETKEPTAAVRFLPASNSQVISEFLDFKDSSVLFLPGSLSSGVPTVGGSLPHAPSAEPQPPKTSVPDPWASLKPKGPDNNSSARREEIMRAMARSEADGFGTDPEPPDELVGRPIEERLQAIVFEHGKGQARASAPLPKDFLQHFGTALWGPAEYAFYVSEGLPAGPPAPTRSSGNAQVDESIQAHFSKPGAIPTLPDGYYLLRIEP